MAEATSGGLLQDFADLTGYLAVGTTCRMRDANMGDDEGQRKRDG
jgi:hypothetical protein